MTARGAEDHLPLPIIVAVVALPMSALMIGPTAFGWGLHHFPRTAAAIAVLLVAAVLFAATSFSYFFPTCGAGMTPFRPGNYCAPSHPARRP